MNAQNINIREYLPFDLKETASLFFESIRRGAARHYTEEQLLAWAPEVPNKDVWRDRMHGLKTWIAETEDQIIGFMSLTETGHIEFAFVHPDWIGKGIAGRLYGFVERYALAKGMPALTSDASLFARPLFERHGWRVIKKQQPMRNDVTLTNFRMEKILAY